MAAEAFAALGDRADAIVFAQATERVSQSFQSLAQRSAWTAIAESAAVRWRRPTRTRAGRAKDSYPRRTSTKKVLQAFWSARCRLVQAALAGVGGPAERYLLDDAAIVFEQLGAMALAATRRAT
jgi:hypothetical protein